MKLVSTLYSWRKANFRGGLSKSRHFGTRHEVQEATRVDNEPYGLNKELDEGTLVNSDGTLAKNEGETLEINKVFSWSQDTKNLGKSIRKQKSFL